MARRSRFPRSPQSHRGNHRLSGDVPRRRPGKRTGLGHEFLPPPAQAESFAGYGETLPRRSDPRHRACPGTPQGESQRHRGPLRPGDLVWPAVGLLLGGQEILARFPQGRHRGAAPAQSRVRVGSRQRRRPPGAGAPRLSWWVACPGITACWDFLSASTETRNGASARFRKWPQKGKINRVEAEIFLCAIYRRENQTSRAVPIVQDLIARFPRNYILRLELSEMYSMAGDGATRPGSGPGSGPPENAARPRLRPDALGTDLLPGRAPFSSGTAISTAPWRI